MYSLQPTNLSNPFSCTMTLGLIQPLSEISNVNFIGEVGVEKEVNRRW
jgi:hypothetical protein